MPAEQQQETPEQASPEQDGWHPLERRVGWRFRQPALLREALTHRSYAYESPEPGLAPNERLEFLGDAILGFLCAEYLFRTYPTLSEGELTTARAALVKAPTLAGFARGLQLGEYLRMGRGEARSGGRKREPLLAAAFEALLGALYLDGALDEVRRFLLPLLEQEAQRVIGAGRLKDDKSLLQELAQAHLGVTPSYRIVAEEGPAHQRRYTVEVLLGSQVAGQGQGRNKQSAEQEAARQALEASGWL
ncbi:MAG TPA: ribonuclease III [Ktedonobacterales bacterium]|nr:ribonuclease III [Ktedonobacterales bacterium]